MDECTCRHEDIIQDIKKDLYGSEGIKIEVATMKTDMAWVKRIGIAIIVLLTGNLATMVTIFINIKK